MAKAIGSLTSKIATWDVPKAGDTAQPLFNHLEAAGIVPRHMERIVLGAATPRNRQGGHGAGAIAHNPDPAEAQFIQAVAYCAHEGEAVTVSLPSKKARSEVKAAVTGPVTEAALIHGYHW